MLKSSFINIHAWKTVLEQNCLSTEMLKFSLNNITKYSNISKLCPFSKEIKIENSSIYATVSVSKDNTGQYNFI